MLSIQSDDSTSKRGFPPPIECHQRPITWASDVREWTYPTLALIHQHVRPSTKETTAFPIHLILINLSNSNPVNHRRSCKFVTMVAVFTQKVRGLPGIGVACNYSPASWPSNNMMPSRICVDVRCQQMWIEPGGPSAHPRAGQACAD